MADDYEVTGSSSNLDSNSSESCLSAASAKYYRKRATSSYRKGKKRKYSPPSSGSSASTCSSKHTKRRKRKKAYICSDSGSSENEEKRRKRHRRVKKGHTQTISESFTPPQMKHRKRVHSAKNVGSTRRKYLLNVFRKHYDSLVTMIQMCPQVITNKLFAKQIISDETLSKIITGCDSKMTKASTLLCDVRTHLKVDPEKLIDFVNILKEERSLDFLTAKMMGKCSKYVWIANM